MELIDKIRNKFYSWAYNLWDSIGEDNGWHKIHFIKFNSIRNIQKTQKEKQQIYKENINKKRLKNHGKKR